MKPQSEFKVGKPYIVPNTEKVFIVDKLYDDGGILFKSCQSVKTSCGNDINGHKFKLFPSQYKNFTPIDAGDCFEDGGFSF